MSRALVRMKRNESRNDANRSRTLVRTASPPPLNPRSSRHWGDLATAASISKARGFGDWSETGTEILDRTNKEAPGNERWQGDPSGDCGSPVRRANGTQKAMFSAGSAAAATDATAQGRWRSWSSAPEGSRDRRRRRRRPSGGAMLAAGMLTPVASTVLSSVDDHGDQEGPRQERRLEHGAAATSTTRCSWRRLFAVTAEGPGGLGRRAAFSHASEGPGSR